MNAAHSTLPRIVLAVPSPDRSVHRGRPTARRRRCRRFSMGLVYGRRFPNRHEPPPTRRLFARPIPRNSRGRMDRHSLPHDRTHRCPACRRLLGVQTGPSLHIRRRDSEILVVGRAELRCRCGAVTVVITSPVSPR